MREKISNVLPLFLFYFQIWLRKLTRYAKCSGYVERRFDVVFGHNLHIWHRLLFQASHFSFLQNRFYWSAWKKYENIFILNQNILKHFLVKKTYTRGCEGSSPNGTDSPGTSLKHFWQNIYFSETNVGVGFLKRNHIWRYIYVYKNNYICLL